MESEFITLEFEEYLNVCSFWKEKINPYEFTAFPWGFSWNAIGLEYYEALPQKRKFKVLDHTKWMQHWILVKINN